MKIEKKVPLFKGRWKMLLLYQCPPVTFFFCVDEKKRKKD